jgi:hypothetical protein
MEFNRYPENYFAEVEQAAFSPANIVTRSGRASATKHSMFCRYQNSTASAGHRRCRKPVKQTYPCVLFSPKWLNDHVSD